MAIKISPSKLRVNIWRKGPYVYYFNGDDKYINRDLVKNMREFAEKNRFVTVFEIDWTQFMDFENGKPTEQINKVYIYKNGKEESTEPNPSKQKLEDIFLKCMEFVENKYLEISDRNLKKTGKESMNLQNDEYLEKKQRENRLRRRSKKLWRQRKRVEKGKKLEDFLSDQMLKNRANDHRIITPKTHYPSINLGNREYQSINEKHRINNYYSNSQKILSKYTPAQPITINKIPQNSGTNINIFKTTGNNDMVYINKNIVKNTPVLDSTMNINKETVITIENNQKSKKYNSLVNVSTESKKKAFNKTKRKNSIQHRDITRKSYMNSEKDKRSRRIKEKIEKKRSCQYVMKNAITEKKSSNYLTRCNSPIEKKNLFQTKNELPLDLSIKNILLKSPIEKNIYEEI